MLRYPKPLFVQLLLLNKGVRMHSLPACVYVHHVHAGVYVHHVHAGFFRGQKGLSFPGTKVTGGVSFCVEMPLFFI